MVRGDVHVDVEQGVRPTSTLASKEARKAELRQREAELRLAQLRLAVVRRGKRRADCWFYGPRDYFARTKTCSGKRYEEAWLAYSPGDRLSP
jgi:hypothetical protein